MASPLAPGLKGQVERIVAEKDTARQIARDHLPVLATPVMIAMMECAAVAAIDGKLAAGAQTVGIHVDVRHIAATPLGMKAIAFAELTKVEGRTLTFRVWAQDDKEAIGEGTHQRAVIDVARFMQRVQAKAGKD